MPRGCEALWGNGVLVCWGWLANWPALIKTKWALFKGRRAEISDLQEWRARWDRMDGPYEDLKCQIEMVSGSSPQAWQGGLDNSRKLEKLTYRPLKAHFSNQRPVLVPSSVNAPNITKPIFCFFTFSGKAGRKKVLLHMPFMGRTSWPLHLLWDPVRIHGSPRHKTEYSTKSTCQAFWLLWGQCYELGRPEWMMIGRRKGQDWADTSDSFEGGEFRRQRGRETDR